ncbi:hypothetical protein F7725_023327 [Dissostichus mawsoni]|uniref:LIM zinc-binding domain-containing protein n=1 Tax=Dissostichus mawsoni TaxID=36200 RepID=A0A7J5Z0D4_DISMA|nr:hypothetical protein F7725_023327 [Dissostichus mawsoni]
MLVLLVFLVLLVLLVLLVFLVLLVLLVMLDMLVFPVLLVLLVFLVLPLFLVMQRFLVLPVFLVMLDMLAFLVLLVLLVFLDMLVLPVFLVMVLLVPSQGPAQERWALLDLSRLDSHNRPSHCQQPMRVGEPAVYAERAGYDKMWHPACFVCCNCSELLLIFSNEYTQAEGQNWHLKHFCCFECDCILAGETYVMENDKPVCQPCYMKSYAVKCSSCQLPLEPEAQRVSYGDFHWHADPQCFKCSGCSKCLVGQRFMAVKNFLFCSVDCKKKIVENRGREVEEEKKIEAEMEHNRKRKDILHPFTLSHNFHERMVTNEQYNPEAVEEERLPLDLSSLKTSITDRSSTEVTNEQYNPEAVEEERLPLELTSLKTSTTDRSSTEVTNEQYNPEAVEEERLPLELTSLKTSTTDRSSTELFTVRGYSLVDYPDTDEEDEDFIQNCDEGNPKLRITEDVLMVRVLDFSSDEGSECPSTSKSERAPLRQRRACCRPIQTDLAGSDVSTADSEEEYVPNPREGESTDSEGSIEIPIIKKSNGVIQDTEESEGEASMSSLPGKFLTKHQKSAKKRDAKCAPRPCGFLAWNSYEMKEGGREAEVKRLRTEETYSAELIYDLAHSPERRREDSWSMMESVCCTTIFILLYSSVIFSISLTDSSRLFCICSFCVFRYLKVFQALVELPVGQVEFPLRLCALVSGRRRLFLLQLPAVEVNILQELLILLCYANGVGDEKGLSWFKMI